MIPALVAIVLLLAGGILLELRSHHAVASGTRPPEKAATNTAPAPTLTAPDGMVTVPAGTFLFGKKKEEGNLPAYFIDKTEVTNAQYQKFCAETGHALPADFTKDHPELPVVNVDFDDAQAYAKWAGKRLPTGPEWEKAARGTEGNLFPWGNQMDASRANLNSKGVRAADDFPSGASPYGALQMVGNVWEWTAQLSQPTQYGLDTFAPLLKPKPGPDEPWYQMRGMGFREKLIDGAVWDSAIIPARWKAIDLGFRCVKDAQ